MGRGVGALQTCASFPDLRKINALPSSLPEAEGGPSIGATELT